MSAGGARFAHLEPLMTAVLLALILPGALQGQPPVDALPAAQAIPAMTQQLVDALPGDRAVWQRYLSERAVYVSEAGIVATKAELLAGFAPFPEGLAGSISVVNPRVTDFGDVAVCVFDAREQQQVYDQQIAVDYRSTHTWRREEGKWRLIAAQNVVVARDPAPLPADTTRWKQYAGTYQLAGKRRYVVQLQSGGLFGGPVGGAMAPLIPVGENVFAEAGSALGVLRIFLADSGGAVNRMVQRRKFADITWLRVADYPR